MQLPLGHDPVLCKKGGYGKCYKDEINISNINKEHSVDNKCINVCINVNVETINSRVSDTSAQSKYGHNVGYNQMLQVNSESTSQSGCRADVLCPTGDCKGLCMISNSSIGAACGLNANFKNDTNNTNSTSSNVVDLNDIVGPRVIPVTNHNNTIVRPQSYSVTSAE